MGFFLANTFHLASSKVPRLLRGLYGWIIAEKQKICHCKLNIMGTSSMTSVVKEKEIHSQSLKARCLDISKKLNQLYLPGQRVLEAGCGDIRPPSDIPGSFRGGSRGKMCVA